MRLHLHHNERQTTRNMPHCPAFREAQDVRRIFTTQFDLQNILAIPGIFTSRFAKGKRERRDGVN